MGSIMKLGSAYTKSFSVFIVSVFAIFPENVSVDILYSAIAISFYFIIFILK